METLLMMATGQRSVRIMGILNVTPDSFYDGGRYSDREKALRHGLELAAQGADIIDIGGESTRPGSEPVSEQEEMDRVIPVIEAIKRENAVPLSIDTTKAGVAEEALKAGAEMVNDISGLTFDSGIADVAARYGAFLVLMHMQGRPRTMQENPRYEDLIGEIRDFLSAAAQAAQDRGVARGRIIVDPGIGFGKTLEDNYRIINRIGEFRESGYPVLVGLSRKSLIGKLYSGDEDRLPATIALNMAAVLNGADIIRVHDVRAHRLALMSIEKLKQVS
jgi:dihydropteroate synthase